MKTNRTILSNQICCKDLWYLETERPPAPSKCQLVKTTPTLLDIVWGQVSNADSYLVQIQRCDNPPAACSNAISTPNTKLNGQATPVPSNAAAPSKVQLTTTTAQGLNASTIQQQIANKINPKIVVQQPQIKIVQQKPTSNIVQQTPTAAIGSGAQLQQPQQIVINNASTVQQSTPTNSQQTSTTQMSGMAALAAAACATQKIQGKLLAEMHLASINYYDDLNFIFPLPPSLSFSD